MRKFSLILSAVMLVLLGVGCSSLQTTLSPTPLPLNYIPTVAQLTLQAWQTDTPTATPAPPNIPADFPPISPTSTPDEITSGALNSPTPLALADTSTTNPTSNPTSTVEVNSKPAYLPIRTPTFTPTPTLSVGSVQINMPGPMSKVVSPMRVTANIRTVPSGTYRVELWIEPLQSGGDPRLIYREVQKIISNPGNWIYLDEKIEFELSRVSEYGQLRLSVYDIFERPISINSVDLILLQMGSSQITPSSGKTEPIVIDQPSPNQLIQGGKVVVSGVVRPSQDYLQVKLVAFDGTVVGYRDIRVTPSPDGSYVPYTAEVPYIITTPTWVRLQISESSTRIPGLEHLSSVQVLLSP